MLTHMEKKWRISAKSRYMPTTTTSSSGESPSGQARGTLPSMSRFVRFFSIGFMILVVLPEEIQATVYMINQCGRTIHSAGDLIFSQGGLYYPSNTNCTVTIATLSGEGRVLLQLHDSELNSNEDCSDDYLELSSIKAKDDNGNSINTQRICGSTSPMEVMSDGPSLRIHLVSDGVGSGRGWSGAFANILPVDIPLCLGYERFQCHNRRCIPSVLRCDSVNHCGDNSDETFGCKDDLPYYFGDRVLEQEEAIYIGVAVAFTALFAIFFTSVCTRDTCKQIKRRVKKLMTRSHEEYNESFEKDLEAELRKALMARSMYDRRVSQPYDSTLNTITGGELARQLKLELRKIQQNGGSNGYQLPDPQSSTQRSINENYDKINSTSELIHLMNFDRKNNNHSDQGSSNKAHFLEIPQKSEHRVSIESIPSVVVSEDGDELKREVLYDPKEVFSKGEAKNLSRGLYQKRLSRSSTSSLKEEQSPSEIGATLTNGNKISMSSRFSVTAVPEDKSLAKSEGASMSNQKKVGSSSRFQVMTIPDENLLSKSDGVPISDQHRGERVSRFQITAVPEERLLSGQGDTPVSTKSSSSSKPRFSVSRVPEDEVQLPAKVQRLLSTPTTSRFSVTSVEENEQKKEGTSYIRKPGDFSRGVATIPSNRYLQVPSHRRSSAGAGRTVSSIPKQRSNRFNVQSLEDPLQNKQGDSKDTSLSNDSVGNTEVGSSIKSGENKKTDKPTNATSSRFTVQRVPEEPQAPEPKKLVGILKKFETLPDGTRSYTKQPDQPRFRRASEGASLDSPDDVTDGLPSSALTVHGYTSVRFWDEKRGKYSYESHL